MDHPSVAALRLAPSPGPPSIALVRRLPLTWDRSEAKRPLDHAAARCRSVQTSPKSAPDGLAVGFCREVGGGGVTEDERGAKVSEGDSGLLALALTSERPSKSSRSLLGVCHRGTGACSHRMDPDRACDGLNKS